MTASSLSQQCLQAITLMLQPFLLSQWTLRMIYIATLFAVLQAISAMLGAPTLFMWCNVGICLWIFNHLCIDVQHAHVQRHTLASDKQPFILAGFPLLWGLFFFVLFGCFVLLDYIPYVGPVLSTILTPLVFLLATMPALGVVIQLILPIFVFPYIGSAEKGGLMLLFSSFQFIQQPARTLSYFLLAYTPLVITVAMLVGSWETVYMMDRFSSFWPIQLLQKSLLIILSGICLAPATLFLTLMGLLPAMHNAAPRGSRASFTQSESARERAKWFTNGESQ